MVALRFSSLLALVSLVAYASAAPATVSTQDVRLIKYSAAPGEVKTEWVSTSALEFLQDPSNTDLSAPELAGLSDEIISALTSTRRGPGYIDITDFQSTEEKRDAAPIRRRAYPDPDPSKYSFLEDTYFGQVDASGLSSTVDYLSNTFTTRASSSTNATAVSTWIQDQFTAAAGSANVEVVTNSFPQSNVIARIPGSSSDEVVIVGAHMDSTTGGSSSSDSRAPGADDDASGIAVILQALQILTDNGYAGSRTIEFHAYAGEEGGLLGSQTVASQYKSAGTTVVAMLMLDMVAYQVQSKPILTVFTDTDSTLVSWSQALISAYLPSDSLYTNECGYACSDHFSWDDQGYAAVSIDESGENDSQLNPYYHSTSDTIDKLDFTKAAEFVKMVMAFVVEQAE